ncbi:MAG: hypothetical protein ACWIPI_04550, partial [Polaribacter sp.]
QPPQTDDNVTSDEFKQEINTAILIKASEKNYLYYDMYKALGGQQKVIDLGWGGDPVHLSLDAYASIASDVLNYLGLLNNLIISDIHQELITKKIYIDTDFDDNNLPSIETDNFNFDLKLRAKRYLQLFANNEEDNPIVVLDGNIDSVKHMSVGDRLLFAHDGTKTVPGGADANSPTLYRLKDVNGQGLRVKNITALWSNQ